MTYPVYKSLLVDHIWMLLLLQRIFSESPVLMLLCLIVDHWYGCFSYFRGIFQQVQDSFCNLTSKLSFSVVFFRMIHNDKLARSSSAKVLELSRRSNLNSVSNMWLEKMKRRRKFSKNCSMRGKKGEISGPYNFWTPIKNNTPNIWNWSCWTFFGWEIEVRGGDGGKHGPPGPPSGYTPEKWFFRRGF